MTHEEIERAIGKLRELTACSNRTTGSEIVGAIVGYLNTDDACDKLIELLEQADPDTHMVLPVDADSVPIHIGDKVESDHREDGTVVGIEYCEDSRVRIAVRPYNWDTPTWWCDPEEYRHHNKPTVKEVLAEYTEKLLALHNDYDLSDSADDELALLLEYAERFKEVTSED